MEDADEPQNGRCTDEQDSVSRACEPASVEPGDAYRALLVTIFEGIANASEASAADDGSPVDDRSASDIDEDGALVNDQTNDDRTAGQAVASTSAAAPSDVFLQEWHLDIDVPEAATTEPAVATKPPGASKKVRDAVFDARKAARSAARRKDASAGAGWFGMKAPVVTDEVKRDWRLLRLRAAFSPKTFYKKFDSTKIPKHFEMGEIIEGRGEFYSGRMTKRERKQTMTEELLADVELKRSRTRRYEKMQAERQAIAKKQKKVRGLHKRSRHRPKH